MSTLAETEAQDRTEVNEQQPEQQTDPANPVGSEQETEAKKPEESAVSSEQKPDGAKPEEKKPDDQEEKSRRNREGYERRLQRERAELKAERDALRRQIEQMTAPQQPANQKPAREGFATDEEYLDALADYKVAQKLEEKTKELDARRENTEISATVKSAVDEARTKYGEVFEEAFHNVKDIEISNPVLKSMLRNKETASEIVNEIVVNRPDILTLPDVEAIGEIAAIRNSILAARRAQTGQSQTQSQQKKTTSAPPPIKPPAVSGGALKKDLTALDGDDYKRARGYIR